MKIKMRLNSIKSIVDSSPSKRRVGRGIGSGFGKTAGRGHKGQKSRAGGFHKVGFEGGQMPLQRRLPKRGFASRTKGSTVEVKLSELDKLPVDSIDIKVLVQAGIIPKTISAAKVILSGSINKKITLHGIFVTKGAKIAIENLGGSVE